MPDETVIIELMGDFPVDAAERLEPKEAQDLVDVALGTGFGADRVLKFIGDMARPTVDALKKLIANAAQANRVTGFKVTKNGVEVASFHVDDSDRVMRMIDEVLDRLGGR